MQNLLTVIEYGGNLDLAQTLEKVSEKRSQVPYLVRILTMRKKLTRGTRQRWHTSPMAKAPKASKKVSRHFSAFSLDFKHVFPMEACVLGQ